MISGLVITSCKDEFYVIKQLLQKICEVVWIENEKDFHLHFNPKSACFVSFNPDTKNINLIKVLTNLHSMHTHIPIFMFSGGNQLPNIENLLGFKPDAQFLLSYNSEDFLSYVNRIVKTEKLKSAYPPEHEALYTELIGISPAVCNLRKFILKAAAQECPVMLYGETGCGKDITAKLIHFFSSRKKGPYVPVNVSCIPDNLAESVLFGSRKGSYTDAQNKNGFLADAHNGTLFFDEIEELSPAVQAKLLRAIETHHIRALGAEREIESNFRLICASNKNIKELVENKRFREDLYYRLDVLHFNIAPLRNRSEDIPLLAEYYCKNKGKRISEKAIDKLLLRRWKGNIRELFNCLERACVNAYTEEMISALHIEF